MVPQAEILERLGERFSLTPVPDRGSAPAELFFGFAKISVTGFGMILPWARRMIVDEKRWMTATKITPPTCRRSGQCRWPG